VSDIDTTNWVPARTSTDREAFVVEVWNEVCDYEDEMVTTYAELADAHDFPGSVWPCRYAMLVVRHLTGSCESEYALHCHKDWDTLLNESVKRMANDDPEYPRYALDLDRGEYWIAEQGITLRRTA
jgi:hypothetical protein